MKYVVLLRGINISGKNKISMFNLKEELELLNYNNVKTYLNSGNIILESNDTIDNIKSNIHNMINDKFNLDIPVYVITSLELIDVYNYAKDWCDNHEYYYNIIFMINTTFNEVYKTIGDPSYNIDKIENYKNVILWAFDLKNYRKSNWWIKTASTDIKDKITIRTFNTIKKLVEML